MSKSKPSILFVLKDAKFRAILEKRFTTDGWKAQGAEDIEDGERKAVRLQPNVFFVELHDISNLKKQVKHWKSLPTLMKSKIVLLLPKAERVHVDEALQNGADQVILSGTLLPKEIVKSLSRHV